MGLDRACPGGGTVDLPSRCPVCNFQFSEARDSRFVPPKQCPYAATPYPELCSLHDKIYFSHWRRMDAGSLDVRRAYGKIVHLLSAIGRIAAEDHCEQARRHLREAADVLSRSSPGEDPFHAVKFMDQALSYAHHAINGLILGRGGRPHDPLYCKRGLADRARIRLRYGGFARLRPIAA